MSVHRQFFPDEEDEKGAAKALMRLQDTYKLDSESFSKGKLPGKEGMVLDNMTVCVCVCALPECLRCLLRPECVCLCIFVVFRID